MPLHGRLVLLSAFLSLSACSKNSLLKPDCHSCTVEEQEWKAFSWSGLLGKWRGSVESLRNTSDSAAKRQKSEKNAELNFVLASDLLQAWGSQCKGLPPEALVLNGVLWEGGAGAKEYEAFVPVEKNRVAYGRVSFSKLNGQGYCHFRRLGRVMGKNRLNLPSVSFSDRVVSPGRTPASPGESQEMSVEFLRYASKEKAVRGFSSDGRRPASAQEQEKPALILRVFRVGVNTRNGGRGEWNGTEEQVYRLWRTE